MAARFQTTPPLVKAAMGVGGTLMAGLILVTVVTQGNWEVAVTQNFQANAGNAGGNSSFTYSSNTVTQSNLNTVNYGGGFRAGPSGQNSSGIAGGNIFANHRNARQAGSLTVYGATRFNTQQGAGASGGSGAGIMIGF